MKLSLKEFNNKTLSILALCLIESITAFGETVKGITRPWSSFGVHDAIVTRFTVNGELCLTLTNRVGLSNWSQADLNGNPICLDYYNQLCYEDGESSPSSAFRDIDGGPWSPLIDYTLNYDSEDKSIYYIFTGWKGSDGNFVYGMDCPSDEQEVFEAQFINWTETLSDVSSSVAGMYDGYDATLGPIDKISACLATRYDNVVTYEGQTFEDWENCHDGISDRIIMAGKKPVLFAKIAVCHVLVWDSKAGRYYQNEKTVSLNATLWIRKCPGTRIDSRIEKPYYRKIELGAVPVKFTKENSGDKLVAFAYEIPDILPVGRYQYHFEFNSDRSILEDDYTNNSQGGLFDVRYPDFKLRVEPIDANEDSVLLRWRVDDDMLSDQASDEYLESCWRRYNVWRGTGETDWDSFDAAELIGRNRSFPYFVDNKFGKVPGVKPVRYWVEKFTTASSEIYQNPTNTPEAYCDVRRSPFGVAMEKVDGQRILALTTIGSDVFWDDAESKAGVSRNSFTATRDATPFVDDSIPRCYVGIAPESGGYAFEIKAPASWTLTSDSAWLRPSKGSGVKGSSVITVQVGQNVEAAIRKGRLTFFCDGGEWVFDIVQDVMPKVLDWNVYGRGTEKEQDRVTGDPVGDPCLVADGRFVVKLQFSHFNYERYPINLIDLKGEAKRDTPARNNIDWHLSKTVKVNSDFSIELAEVDQRLPKGDGFHGAYDFSINVACDKVGEIEVEKDELTDKKVFFDKYGKDNGREPNWFVYWNKDGAVPALSYGESPGYSDVEGFVNIDNLEGLNESLVFDVDKVNAWGKSNPETGLITLFKKAAEVHYSHTVFPGSLIAGGINFRGRFWVYGIYTAANVIAHERQHIATYQTYISDLNAAGVSYPGDRVGIKKENQDFAYDDDGRDAQESVSFGMGTRIALWWHNDVDDHLTNAREASINEGLGRKYSFVLDSSRVDTFNLAANKDKSYAKDGDDEFMSMLAGHMANEDSKTAIEEKDWAYPGHQSYLPDYVARKKTSSVKSVTHTHLSLAASVSDPGGGIFERIIFCF